MSLRSLEEAETALDLLPPETKATCIADITLGEIASFEERLEKRATVYYGDSLSAKINATYDMVIMSFVNPIANFKGEERLLSMARNVLTERGVLCLSVFSGHRANLRDYDIVETIEVSQKEKILLLAAKKANSKPSGTCPPISSPITVTVQSVCGAGIKRVLETTDRSDHHEIPRQTFHPLIPLSVWHSYCAIAGGLWQGCLVSTKTGERMLVKGYVDTCRVIRERVRTVSLPDGREISAMSIDTEQFPQGIITMLSLESGRVYHVI
jgi:hypothetical protein